jgi:hypothetical protein
VKLLLLVSLTLLASLLLLVSILLPTSQFPTSLPVLAPLLPDVFSFFLLSVLRIRDVYPGSRIYGQKIPDPGSASKNLCILTQKIVFKLSEM